jgi:hypothetical protein
LAFADSIKPFGSVLKDPGAGRGGGGNTLIKLLLDAFALLAGGDGKGSIVGLDRFPK